MSPDALKRGIRLLLPPIFWLGVWQLAAQLVGRELLLPGPVTVFRALGNLMQTRDFWLSAGLTMLRVFAGLAWGTIAGALLALATHFNQWANAVLAPAVRMVRATPVVSFILLVYLWVSRAAIPAVISGMMVLPVVWGAVSSGLAGTDPALLEMGTAYRFSPWKKLWLIYLPSCRGPFISGLLTAFGLAWKSGIAAEVLCPPAHAVGSKLQAAKVALETADLFAWTLVVAALSLLLEKGLRFLLERRAEK